MLFLKRRKYVLIFAFVLAFFLCGAASAATNTTKEKSTAAYSAGKDLVITKLTASKYIAKNTKIVIKTTVKNKGKKSAKGNYVYYYLVPKKSMSGYKKYLGKKYFPALKSGKSVTKKAVFKVPSTLRYNPSKVHPPWKFKPVTYYVVAKADGNKKIKESKEKNNIRYTSSQTQVFYRKIDSGTKYFKNYRKFTWVTFLINSKDILSYCHYYDPYFVDSNWNPKPHWITQKYIIGTYTENGFSVYLYLNPKQNGRSDYIHYSGGWKSPLAVYWQNGKSMFEEGPNNH